jgi:hypothetical protein
MDWLQFIAAVIGHIAWPVVILVLLVMVRKHIGALADRISEFSFGGAKAVFDKNLEKGREIIEVAREEKAVELPSVKNLKASDFAISRIEIDEPVLAAIAESMLQKNPSFLIAEAFNQVEKELAEIATIIGSKASGLAVLHELISRGAIQAQLVLLYRALADARSAAAHSKVSMGRKEAEEFINQASFLSGYLLAIKSDLLAGKFKEKPRDSAGS